jgi:hypothetical protein
VNVSDETHTEPPRYGLAPGGGMPDNCIGGDVEGGGGSGGHALLLNPASGQPADNVIENQIALTRVSRRDLPGSGHPRHRSFTDQWAGRAGRDGQDLRLLTRAPAQARAWATT